MKAAAAVRIREISMESSMCGGKVRWCILEHDLASSKRLIYSWIMATAGGTYPKSWVG